jgi:hypothetical protein
MATIEPPSRAVRVETNSLMAQVREFIGFKKRIDDLTKQQSVIKTELMEVVEQEGIEDDKGHFWLELPEEVDGYVSLQRQRRATQKINPEVALHLLKARGLADRCIKTIEVVDEDEIMACLYEDLLSEKDMDDMLTRTVTWAFVPSKK